jgi:anaerobic magnesium-protoporphyrin IX monomethyl ester cyclase
MKAAQYFKICLIIAPSSFLMDERVFPSLGILKIAASLEAMGIKADVLDLSGVQNFTDVVSEYLDTYQPTVCGLSATTPQLPAVLEIAKIIGAHKAPIRKILGGPHVTLTVSAVEHEEKQQIIGGRAKFALQQLHSYFDVLVSGDGDLSILEAIKSNSAKLIDGDSKNSPYFMNNETYNKSPMPARHLIDLNSYHYEIEGHKSTSLIAQLGCPFSCGFCGGRHSRSLRVPRTRGIDTIISEIEFLYNTYGYTGYMFFDDELNVNKKHFISLLTELKNLQSRLGVEFRLRGFVKAELFDENQAQAMFEAGFRWLLCGFEAADPRILLNIQKRATLDDNNKAVAAAKSAGLKVKALMSCGHPGETEKSIHAIQDWLIRSDVDDFDCTIITPYPGTPYYDEAHRLEGEKDVWCYSAINTGDHLYSYDVDFINDPQYYKGDPEGGYKSFVYTDDLSSDDIVRLRGWVETTVRQKLNIAYPQARAALQFEHSMGQGIPGQMLRRSHVN